MARWVTEELENLLHQINEVPFTDSREHQQLTLLMNGFAQLNNKVMDRAASKTRKEFRGWSLEDICSSEDPTNEELTRLRPIR